MEIAEIVKRIANGELSIDVGTEQVEALLNPNGKISLSYSGRKEPWQIIRLVKPKVTKIVEELSVGSEEDQAVNTLIEGENLSAMIGLYKYRGQVDLIVTDPPYNADRDFRYNDKWDTNPDDPNLGDIVLADDGSKHSKWLRFMAPRLYLMKEMLKPKGVIAICIDHRELFRLGVLLDEIFEEKNRLAIINWQKSYSPKSNNKHVSTATEYVLVYAKDLAQARTALEERTGAMDSNYGNPDGDPNGDWNFKKSGGDPTASSDDVKSQYGIQNPMTGEVHYPKAGSSWRTPKKQMKAWLEEWGVEYEEKSIGDGKYSQDKNGRRTAVKALVVKGAAFSEGGPIANDPLIASSKLKAQVVQAGTLPQLFFTGKGTGSPRLKVYLRDVKQGKVPLTWWASDEYDNPVALDSSSWDYNESGHSQAGLQELDLVVGPGHSFRTAKPLKLIKKVVQLWCPPDGIVLDPFAGSGTTGQAVLELNHEAGANRSFILIEQGNAATGDHYAKTLTADRLKRVITGDWASGPRTAIRTGFRYVQLQAKRVDADAVAALAREEMIDILTTSYWNAKERSKSSLKRVHGGKFLFASNSKNEGFFLIWNVGEQAALTEAAYDEVLAEAAANSLSMARFHVYAPSAPYAAQKVEFYKIPDKVLEQLGFNASQDAFHQGN